MLKLFTGSIVTYEETKPMPLDVARAAEVEAHREGRLVWAHPTNIQGVATARDASIGVLAHTTSAAGAWSSELVQSLIQHKMPLIPTLKLWRYVTEGAPASSAGSTWSRAALRRFGNFRAPEGA